MTIFVIDIIVNVFESIAAFSLILAIYLFPIRAYLSRIFIAAVLMAQTSYIVREVFHYGDLTPIFMLVWVFLTVWLLFKVHAFYALLMSVTGYISYIALQLSVTMILQFIIDFKLLTGDFYYQKLIQVISLLLTFAISAILIKKRIGLTFVPDRMQVKVNYQGINRTIMMVLIIASVFIMIFGFFAFNTIYFFFVFSLISIAVIMAILYLAIWKERKE